MRYPMNKLTLCLLVSTGIVFSQQAMADASGAGWYAGAGIGYAHLKDDVNTSGLTSYSRDSNDTGGKLFVGYRFNDYLGLEAAYIDFGKEKFTYQDPSVHGSGNVKVSAYSMAAVGRLPLGNSFALLGKIGVANAQAKYNDNWSDTGVPGSTSGTKNTTVPVLGIGVDYALGKSLSLRAEYEDYGKPKIVEDSYLGTAKIKTELLSVGLAYHF